MIRQAVQPEQQCAVCFEPIEHPSSKILKSQSLACKICSTQFHKYCYDPSLSMVDNVQFVCDGCQHALKYKNKDKGKSKDSQQRGVSSKTKKKNKCCVCKEEDYGLKKVGNTGQKVCFGHVICLLFSPLHLVYSYASLTFVETKKITLKAQNIKCSLCSKILDSLTSCKCSYENCNARAHFRCLFLHSQSSKSWNHNLTKITPTPPLSHQNFSSFYIQFETFIKQYFNFHVQIFQSLTVKQLQANILIFSQNYSIFCTEHSKNIRDSCKCGKQSTDGFIFCSYCFACNHILCEQAIQNTQQEKNYKCRQCTQWHKLTTADKDNGNDDGKSVNKSKRPFMNNYPNLCIYDLVYIQQYYERIEYQFVDQNQKQLIKKISLRPSLQYYENVLRDYFQQQKQTKKCVIVLQNFVQNSSLMLVQQNQDQEQIKLAYMVIRILTASMSDFPEKREQYKKMFKDKKFYLCAKNVKVLLKNYQKKCNKIHEKRQVQQNNDSNNKSSSSKTISNIKVAIAKSLTNIASNIQNIKAKTVQPALQQQASQFIIRLATTQQPTLSLTISQNKVIPCQLMAKKQVKKQQQLLISGDNEDKDKEKDKAKEINLQVEQIKVNQISYKNRQMMYIQMLKQEIKYTNNRSKLIYIVRDMQEMYQKQQIMPQYTQKSQQQQIISRLNISYLTLSLQDRKYEMSINMSQIIISTISPNRFPQFGQNIELVNAINIHKCLNQLVQYLKADAQIKYISEIASFKLKLSNLKYFFVFFSRVKDYKMHQYPYLKQIFKQIAQKLITLNTKKHIKKQNQLLAYQAILNIYNFQYPWLQQLLNKKQELDGIVSRATYWIKIDDNNNNNNNNNNDNNDDDYGNFIKNMEIHKIVLCQEILKQAAVFCEESQLGYYKIRVEKLSKWLNVLHQWRQNIWDLVVSCSKGQQISKIKGINGNSLIRISKLMKQCQFPVNKISKTITQLSQKYQKMIKTLHKFLQSFNRNLKHKISHPQSQYSPLSQRFQKQQISQLLLSLKNSEFDSEGLIKQIQQILWVYEQLENQINNYWHQDGENTGSCQRQGEDHANADNHGKIQEIMDKIWMIPIKLKQKYREKFQSSSLNQITAGQYAVH